MHLYALFRSYFGAISLHTWQLYRYLHCQDRMVESFNSDSARRLARSHGARTPLGKAAFLWEGQEWDVCGRAFDSVPLTLLDAAGQPEPPANQHDAQQVATRLAGGCSKGELTLIGQMQALELGWQLRRRYIDATGFLPASYTPGASFFLLYVGVLRLACAALHHHHLPDMTKMLLLHHTRCIMYPAPYCCAA